MSSTSKVIEDEVQSFIKLMFASFKALRGTRDETEVVLELELG